MTTLLYKTNAHKKAQATSSGFLELMKAFVTSQQGLASEYILLMINHKNNDTHYTRVIWPVNRWRAE